MKTVFTNLNMLENKGIITNYALGGATALLFYAEPALTYDIDIFFFFPIDKENPNNIISMATIYAELKKMGGRERGEHVIIDGKAVQLLPAPAALEEEAVREANILSYEGLQVKVISLEHLIAIMLKTNRAKDRARVGQLLEENVAIDIDKLSDILSRYQLKEQWKKINE